MRAFAVLVALSVAAPTLAGAQPGNTPPQGQLQQPPPAQQPAQPQRIERVKKRIRALRAYTLTEELQLDEATAGRLFPVLARYDDEFDKLLRARAEIHRRLSAASAANDPRGADKGIDEAIANQHAFWETEDKRLFELRKILSPAQTARLLVVLPPLERKIENQLRNAIQGKHPESPDDEDDQRPQRKPRAPRGE